jgi:ABC-type transport system involved in cytochrome bd biosynthesis fused ATPase/permease subunit
MPQRPHLFNASILENAPARARAEGLAALGRPAWRRARATARAAPLGEQGAGLSAGGCQQDWSRVVRDAPLLLLDEPTAALDAATERELLDTIRRIGSGRTVVLAAHRPALLALADSVVRLAPARVTELHGA